MSSDESSDAEYLPEGSDESDIPSEAESDFDEEGNKIVKSKEPATNKRKKRKVNANTSKKKHRGTTEIEQTSKNKQEEMTELEEEREKKRAEALWADFLNDTSSASSFRSKESNAKESAESSRQSSEKNLAPDTLAETSKQKEPPKPEFVTKIFDFAGEEVKIVEKVESVDKPTKDNKKPASICPLKSFGQTSAASKPKGLGSILGQLGRKNKISTLEKSKLDWQSFKQREGLEEELQTFNKGKDG